VASGQQRQDDHEGSRSGGERPSPPPRPTEPPERSDQQPVSALEHDRGQRNGDRRQGVPLDAIALRPAWGCEHDRLYAGSSGPHEYDRAVVEDSRDAPAAAPAARGSRACHVIHDRGSAEMDFSRESTSELLARGGFFWLDLDQPDAHDFEILREVFGFHPLAVEDSEHFDQRAKIEDYDDFVFLVFYGASPDEDRLVEVHCFYSERFLVTVHRDDCPAFAEIRRRYQKRDEAIDRPSLLLYRIVDGLVDSFFPILAAFDNRIDEL
jgi:Mg2+ and Co2+ transporter CorA